MESGKIGLKNLSALSINERSHIKNDRETKKGEKISTGKGDLNVEISPGSRSLAKSRELAIDIAKTSPDIRQDRMEKIVRLKETIKNGTYELDPGNIADGIVREAIKDQIANDPNLLIEDFN